MAYYDFTKTSFVRGMQCPKLIFLDRNRKEFATPPDAETMERFKKGRIFEKQVKDTFEGGFDMSCCGCNFWKKEYVEKTKQILDSHEQCVIFEAGLYSQNEGILILTDVLRKNADGSYDIFEIKHSSALNTAIKWDLSLQYHVCKSVLGNIRSFNVVLREDDADGNWCPKIEDQLDFAKEREPEVLKHLEEFRPLLTGTEPQISIGEQCEKPYKCNFKEYCEKSRQK